MAWLCNRCGKAHADGTPCPYLNSLKSNPEGLQVEILSETVDSLHRRLTRLEDFFKALGNLTG